MMRISMILSCFLTIFFVGASSCDEQYTKPARSGLEVIEPTLAAPLIPIRNPHS
jgi:hypothetical protein